MRYLLPKIFAIGLGWGGVYLAGCLLKHFGLDHGRWQSCLMFLPAVLLVIGAAIIRSTGLKPYGTLVLSGLFFVFGVVILVVG
ncbi:MAG TPA: hypothetical protein VK742_11655 [Candidatus Sulfotelmatobacter sp.]|nr:hypothetical protein [Candidatus Sulfotelmatobacter sp.]